MISFSEMVVGISFTLMLKPLPYNSCPSIKHLVYQHKPTLPHPILPPKFINRLCPITHDLDKVLGFCLKRLAHVVLQIVIDLSVVGALVEIDLVDGFGVWVEHGHLSKEAEISVFFWWV